MTDLIRGLRGELCDCRCSARSSGDCGCGVVWPSQLADDAADRIEELEARNKKAEAIMTRCLALEAQYIRMTRALTKISCPSQTDDLLWWQIEAREALEVRGIDS